MKCQYEFVNHLAELHGLLVDQQSKDLFWARLQCDCEESFENIFRLYSWNDPQREYIENPWLELVKTIRQLNKDQKKVFLYGAKITGKDIGALLLRECDFFGYCARNHEKYIDGVHGKPVYPPEYLFEHSDECYVMVTVMKCTDEIYSALEQHAFPKDHILSVPYLNQAIHRQLIEKQYFDLPVSFPEGRAFVDAGCYDCATSKQFAVWCAGNYSKIFAFEPDPDNFRQCERIASDAGLRIELIPAGLGDCSKEAVFAAGKQDGGFVINSEIEQLGAVFNTHLEHSVKSIPAQCTIQIISLDDVVKESEIGFIKMDIEGEELSALRGAKKTIMRDKPLLAISIYHRRGDVLAIMDYLHELIPQYRFWIRHYDILAYDTVLYAAI